MEKGMPRVAMDLECPIFRESCEVEFSVNVFRDADHKGLEVEACSEFLGGYGSVTCVKTCIHMPEARRLHEEEAKKHRKGLAVIGPSVIG